MNRLLFLFSISVKNICHNKLLTFSKAFLSFVTFILLLGVSGIYENSLHYLYDRGNYINTESLYMYVAEDSSELPQNPQNATHFICYGFNNQIEHNRLYLSETGLAITDINYDSLFDNFCDNGRYINNPDSECVIGYSVARKNNIKINDEISIGLKKYTVCGITFNEGYRSSILVCDKANIETGYPQLYISDEIIIGGGIIYVGNEIHEYFEKMSGAEDIALLIMLIFFLLSLSAVNVLNLTLISEKKEAHIIAVHHTLGAGKATCFFVRFISNIIINAFSFVIAVTTFVLSDSVIFALFSVSLKLSLWCILISFALSALLATLYSINLTGRKKYVSHKHSIQKTA